ncbi:TcpE family conjugal transfer membrane protein [Marinactinospora rubrisoli]|uniref:TcpE family conjugal transfer membrane protein n=1 Tax=Marinactinospora rubrisoli TaxID=2715399 RepID=A0ABW2KBZ1_9ACTN
MDLPTYTNIWRIEKRLYKLYDFRLPTPLPLVTFGVWLGVTLVWMVLMSIIGVPFHTPWHVLWIVPPFVIAFLMTRPVIEGKRLTELLLSQGRYLAEARVYTRLAPQYEPAEITVTARVWHRDPAAGPLPEVHRTKVRLAARRATAVAPGRAGARPVESADPERADARPAAPEPVAPEPVGTDEAVRAAAAPTEQPPGPAERAPAPAETVPPQPAVGAATEQVPAKRSIGLRVLNYFGFALPRPAEDAVPERARPAAARGELGTVKRREEAPSMLPAPPAPTTPGDADADPDPADAARPRADANPWLSAARPSPGGPPPPYPAESTGTAPDTAESERVAARRRAEEIMAAPAPGSGHAEVPQARSRPAGTPGPEAPDVGMLTAPGDITTPRERVVARQRAEASGHEPTPERDPWRGREAQRRLRGRAQGAEVARRLQRERAAAEPPAVEPARGLGAPATPDEAHEQRPSGRQRPRPHAAPWELSAVAPDGPAQQDGTAVANGLADSRPTTGPAESTDLSSLPPGAAAPADFPDPGPAVPAAPEAAPDTTGAASSHPADGTSATGPAGWTAPPEADAFAPGVDAPGQGQGGATGHGAATTSSEGPAQPEDDASGEPRPPGRGAPSGREPEAAVPDGPAAPDAGHPGDPSPLPGRDGGPASALVIPAKPPLELDHGTGEHESFTDVAEPGPRMTLGELQAAERAAFLRRRGADATPRAAAAAAENAAMAESHGVEAPDAAASPEQRAGGPEDEARTAGSAPGPVAEQNGAAPAGESAREPGAFERVARNTRKLGQLFAPASGGSGASGGETAGPRPPEHEATAKPGLELDHGTGEQEVLTGRIQVVPDDGTAVSPADVPGVPRTDAPGRDPDQRPAADAAPQPPAVPSPPGGTRGWRRLARVVTGGNTAASRSELPPADLDRLRSRFEGTRRIVVLGCTGGAGQTVTTLMLGHTLAAHRDGRVVAVDVNPGAGALSRRIRTETPETLTSLLANAEDVHGYLAMRGYTSQSSSGLEVVATLDDPYVQTLDDRDYAGLTGLLERFYEVTLLDPAATGVARALPIADALVLVAPASADAARAVAMTFEWLDGHGYAHLRAKAVMVVNGVSKRSLADVDAAEQVARGRCRAIVRVPWDDHLATARGVVDVGETAALRATTRRAHAALGGVLMSGFTGTGTSGPRTSSEVRR